MNKHKVYLAVFILLITFSCESETEELIIVDETIISSDDSETRSPENIIVYSIPSPHEQIDILHLLNDKANLDLINPLTNVSKYSTLDKKAMNLGAYLADIAYLTRYDLERKMLSDYSSVLDSMCETIGLREDCLSYLKEDLKSENEDSDNLVSLFDISSQNFISIQNELKDKNKNAILAMFLSGAWVETMHILFTQAQNFGDNFEIQANIVDQRFVLENLMMLLNNNKENDKIGSINEYFEKISEVFIKLDCENSNLQIENKEGIIILNGGSTCTFHSNSFEEMKSLIRELRTSIIS